MFDNESSKLLCTANIAINQAVWGDLMVRWRAVEKVCFDHMYPSGSCVSCGYEKRGGGVYKQNEECSDCERLRLGHWSD